MATRLEELAEQLAEVQERIAEELEARRAQLRYRVQRGRAVFDDETRAAHRKMREGLGEFLRHARPLHILTAPVIYGLIIPFVLLDLCVTVYQAVCFPVYRIEKVRRQDYILFDRQLLGYLNLMQKLNCLYCSYCNGLISYVREIAGRTEAYWCPIKHSRQMQGTHAHHIGFVDYGDVAAWRARIEAQRKEHKAGAGAPKA